VAIFYLLYTLRDGELSWQGFNELLGRKVKGTGDLLAEICFGRARLWLMVIHKYLVGLALG
jgi:hypothetical protein